MIPDTHETMFSDGGKRKPLIIFRDTLISLFITLTGIAVWVYTGSVFHLTLRLFTPLGHTAVNILSSFAGFVIMASCAVVASYLLHRLRKEVALAVEKKQNRTFL